MREIYVDNAAAAPVDPRAKKAMLRALGGMGNPSSFNDAGRRAAQELAKARRTVATFLGARPDEVVFTASGSEANNMAIFGLAANSRSGHREVVTTPIEHLSVLEPVHALASRGYRVTFANVDAEGLVDEADLEKKLNERTLLVSVMYANNEMGAIAPIARIGKAIRAFRKKHRTPYPLFHTDACQAAEYLPMDVNRLGVDLLTFNGSKIYGPPGAGVLYVRRGVSLRGLVMGGEQERGLRAGTENLPAIVGLAKAVSLIDIKSSGKVSRLRDRFITALPAVMPEASVNGPVGERRLPNNVNISIPGLDSENLLLELDRYGIRAGSGSACTAHSTEPSHVLKALGVRQPYLRGALRFSLGRQTTKKDVEDILGVLPRVVRNLRARYGTGLKNH